MHPVLVKRQRLGLYLLAWLPLAALLVVLMVLGGGSPWQEAVVLALPLTLIYAFLCLTAWYPCRALPVASAGLLRAISVHGATGVVSSLIWVVLAWSLAQLLDHLGLLAGIGERLADQAVLLAAFGVLAYLMSVAAHYLLAAVESSSEAERRALGAEVAARDAELAMLRAQVDPHFLFNSLNSISALTAADPDAARRMCIELGDFLRGTMRRSRRSTVTLAEELEMVRRFLAIEKVRFGDRLAVCEEVGDGCLDLAVPTMVLQPLVENALKHGIASVLDGGTVELGARCSGDRLRLTVRNPVDSHAASKRGEGVGLANLKERLRVLYGDRAWVDTRRGEAGFEAEVVLPAAASVRPTRGTA